MLSWWRFGGGFASFDQVREMPGPEAESFLLKRRKAISLTRGLPAAEARRPAEGTPSTQLDGVDHHPSRSARSTRPFATFSY